MEPLRPHCGFTAKLAEQQTHGVMCVAKARVSGTKTSRAFTLIELLVVLAIMTIITAIVLSSHSNFNKSLVLANTSYDIALSIRAAQVFGLGSRVPVTTTANSGYGIHFDKMSPGAFTLFADFTPPPLASNCHGIPPSGDLSAPDAKPGDCLYEPGSGEKITQYTLGNGIFVQDFCATGVGPEQCAVQHGGTLRTLDIVYVRPNPEPSVAATDSLGTSNIYTDACLTIASADAPYGPYRYVTVYSSGEITANSTSCQ